MPRMWARGNRAIVSLKGSTIAAMSRVRKCLAGVALGAVVASRLIWGMTLTSWRGIGVFYAFPPQIEGHTPSRFSIKTQRGAVELGFHRYPRLADAFAAREGLLRSRLDGMRQGAFGDSLALPRVLAEQQRALEREIARNVEMQARARATGFSVEAGSKQDRWWPTLVRMRQAENRQALLTIPL